MKFAYLIIAHNEWGVLQELVSALDNENNDIFIHFDKKVKDLPHIHCFKSEIHILEQRIDVRWGTISQIKTELCLFEAAKKYEKYDYYHLISGVHLPIKPLSEINEFYESNKGFEIMRLWDKDERDIRNKLSTYHFGIRWYNSPNRVLRNLSQTLWRYNLCLQLKLGIHRNRGKMFQKADNWLSLTNKAVTFLVEHKYHIIKKYRMSFCADEYFVPTELICSGLFKIRNSPDLLYVDFQKANPQTLRLVDFPKIQASNCLFARKFSQSEPQLLDEVKKLYER